MCIMKKLFKIFEWVIFVVMLCVIVIIASPFLLMKQSISSYSIASGSMEPTVDIGTLIFVKQIPVDTLRKGDIIAFADPTDKARVILHRIYSVTQSPTTRTFQTKGDNNRASDAWIVRPAMLKGKLLFTISYLGYLSELLKTPPGFGIMIGFPALLFIFLSIRNIREGIKEEIEKGIAKRKKNSGDTMFTLLIYATPFFISALILATIPPIYGLNFGHVTISNISISTAKNFISPTPTLNTTPSVTPNSTVSPTTAPSPTASETPSITPSVSPVPTPSIPVFGICPNISGTIQANYATGMHAIVGIIGNLPGSDEVFDIGNNNYTQCYCPVTGTTGIQTNWLAGGGFSKSDVKAFTANGWILIPNGSDWGLSHQQYLTKNLSSTCPVTQGISPSPISPSPMLTLIPSPGN